jgi:hypothetical protein
LTDGSRLYLTLPKVIIHHWEGVCFWDGDGVLCVGPIKKIKKIIKNSVCDWILCINKLYITSNSITKAKTNTHSCPVISYLFTLPVCFS